MISWNSYFEMVLKELKMLKRKKEVLDDLFKEDKVSQSTYDFLGKELSDAINGIETRHKILGDRMASKIGELEEELKTLETFLANLELSYVSGEIDEELYKSENSALVLKVEADKNEFVGLKAALDTLTSEEVTPPLEPVEIVEEATIDEEAPIEEVVESLKDTSAIEGIGKEESEPESEIWNEPKEEYSPPETVEDTPVDPEYVFETQTPQTVAEDTLQNSDETSQKDALVKDKRFFFIKLAKKQE